MFLRKVMIVVLPLLLCLLLCGMFYVTDGELGGASFWGTALKGALLGAGLSLLLLVGGVRAYTTGLAGWLVGGAILLGGLLAAQNLTVMGVIAPVAGRFFLAVNLQVVAAEGAFLGYCLTTGLLYLKK